MIFYSQLPFELCLQLPKATLSFNDTQLGKSRLFDSLPMKLFNSCFCENYFPNIFVHNIIVFIVERSHYISLTGLELPI